ncbi:Ig-like domain-containing domain [Niabella beijingensis]|uniref:Ig-like domain-containing domain n=1 Tax=Niabella beijingensis TaxID=2872700 RepID=UPI001CC01BEC|nr:Ig-like domain-containing domain [Niabella beijingensis]MBZ4189928.1 Ig-like domain-containing protein [Niabella beijingensis]
MFAIHMQTKSLLGVFFAAVTVILLVLSGGGCANIVPPTGGPRDSLPPQIVRVTPADRTKHFDQEKITFYFDEYVDLNDVYQNLVISPLPKSVPQVDRKLKTVTVRLKDSLQPNTTYVLNFTNVIKDITEGNKAKDMLYVVTTGDYFDSLQLSGNVKMAKTIKADSTLTVMLHSNLEDSAVFKQRPEYIAKVDSTGDFLFRYLRPGTYRIYALKDEGGSYLYTSKTQGFAFADSPVVVSATPPPPVRLYAYAEEEQKAAGSAEEPELDKKEKRLKFQINLQGQQQDLLEPLVITFPSALKTYNPEKMLLTTDSTMTPVTGHTFTLDSTRKIITMNMQWQEGTRYNLVLPKDFATDSLDRGLLKPDTIRFTTRERKEYGQARLTFNKLDTTVHPVLLISQGGTLKNAFPLRSNILNIDLYNPGDYDLQVLFDRNNNGKWDPGDFIKHIQPEIIVPLDRKLTFKANWTLEPEINLKEPPK